jgi:hypothetical protein
VDEGGLDFAGALVVAEGELDLVAGVALEKPHDLGEGGITGRGAVDGEDGGIGKDAGLVGGAGFRDGGDEKVFGILAEAEAEGRHLVVENAVLAEHLLHLRVDEGGMGIEAGEHAVERLVDEPVVGDLVEIRVALADSF